ncbi:MAG: nitronate monooxygenase [Rhodospirillaceae bacterium]|jgi:NAD(P)H-dependent flavin oxidoreductase YrpB (nitropropane dioxygenase family)|nr:nitronate monooxygenase [Rhodospirillaceae bacterium]MBT4691468.1 nitronate monooxygenase [Rhodospirillaceae bacterium]MBT5082971.1 nitronate monooxygenase [Rhodospirillaceae bacterium]MBT5524415.1 nitronate monooxygenase [Rhodospirillaceae bacterium]MBT5878789.1 nitronate monooxygenase [Rhodospirillaceae bacterium]
MTRPVLRSELCDLLKIEYPIMLAGMGVWGMGTPPELVAAVSDAGGCGVLGGSALSPEEVRRRIQRVRQLTDKPFGVDLLLPASLAAASTTRTGVREELRNNHPEHVAFMHSLLERFELTPSPVENDIVNSDKYAEAQIEVVLEEKVPIFAAGLGDPARIVPRARDQGMVVIGLAGTVRNAERHKEAGVDLIVCQGTEGGGHTGRVSTLPLVAEAVTSVAPVPIVAAGGISDGRGIAAALTLGAIGVWMGSAFLVAEECGLPDVVKDELVEGKASDFRISESWTGKSLRAKHNVVSDAWAQSGLPSLPTPYQRVLMEDFLSAAQKAGRWDLYMNAAGQGTGMLKQRRPAADIMADLVSGTVQALTDTPNRVEFAQ